MSFRDVGPVIDNVITGQSSTQTVVTASQTLTGLYALANPSPVVTGALYVFKITQDGTGSREISYGSLYKFASGTPPVLSTTADYLDVLAFYSDGTYLYFLSITKNLGASVVAPTLLTATTNQVGQITLHWVDNSSDETSFSIENFDGANWSATGSYDSVAAGVTTYVDTYASTPGSYTYRIRAVRGAAVSAPTNTAVGISL